MAQSKEYPDLKWIAPRSWTNSNRRSVQLVVIHTTEGSAHSQSAEDGAHYDARRIDGTSTHYFHDGNSTVQCVLTADVAHTARGEGNRRGIHHELCTRAASSPAAWAGEYHTAMLQRAARQVAKDCRKWNIPARKLTPEQVKAGAKGICGHHDISLAFRQSTHTDPGKNFPWGRFIGMIQSELNPPPPSSRGDDMPSPEEIAAAVWAFDADRVTPGTQTAGGMLLTENARSRESRTVIEPGQDQRLNQLEQKLDRVLELLAPAAPPTDPQS